MNVMTRSILLILACFLFFVCSVGAADRMPVLPVTTAKTIVIVGYDATTRDALARFVLDFTSCGHKVYYSNEEGQFRMKAPEGFVCHIQISQPGYSKVNLKVDYRDISNEEKTYTVYLSRSSNSQTLRVRDQLKPNLYIAGAEVAVQSLADASVQQKSSDSGGSISFLLARDQHYLVTATKKGYHAYRDTIFSLIDGTFSLESLFLSPIETDAKEPSAPTWRGQPIDARKDKESDRSGLRHYSIQVGATSDPRADLSAYQSALASFGQVHLLAKDDFYRIRVGRFYNRLDAEQQLAKIRQIAGYEKAFLSYNIPGEVEKSVPDGEAAQADVAATNQSDVSASDQLAATASDAPLVRLASYLNPKFFRAELVEGLGEIEMMKKDEWTIALLRGFQSVEAAQAACEQAKSAGFGSAHLVEMVGGKLQKVRGL